MFRKKYLLLFMGKEVMIFYLFWNDIVKLIRYLKEKNKIANVCRSSRYRVNTFFKGILLFFYMSSFFQSQEKTPCNCFIWRLFVYHNKLVLYCISSDSPVFCPGLVLTFTCIISPQRHHKAIPESAASLHSYKGP